MPDPRGVESGPGRQRGGASRLAGEPPGKGRPFPRVYVGEADVNSPGMAASNESDPVRATLLAILKQLNQADAHQDGTMADPALELAELEARLQDFWAVDDGSVKVALAVGLLLRNGLVAARSNTEYSWQRGRAVAQRYQITSDGKRFLVDSIETSNRIQ